MDSRELCRIVVDSYVRPRPEPTTEAGKQYRARWAAVNAITDAEYRAMPLSKRLNQFLRLLKRSSDGPTHPARQAEVEQIRDRWNRLREAYLARQRG
jgi:hypothetical protein